MNFTSITYLFPNALFLLAALLLFVPLLLSLFLHRRSVALQWKNGPLRSPVLFWLKAALFCLAWSLLALCLAEPMGVAEESAQNATLEQKIHEVTFLIDTSASMSIADTRTRKTRLEYAKEIADLIASELRGDKAALYAFTSEPVKIVPMTFNLPFLRFVLEQMQINEGGHAGTDIKLLFEKVLQKRKTYILLTDGGDTDLPNSFQKIVSLVGDARLFVIGLGSKTPSPVPGVDYKGKPVESAVEEALLKAIAKEGLGRYYFANDTTALEIAQDIHRLLHQEEMEKTAFLAAWNEKPYFQYPLALALCCLCLFLLLPDTVKKIALFLCALPLLHAGELEEAAGYFEAKDYQEAENLYEVLLQEPLTPWQRAVVLYNLATTEIANTQWERGIVLLDTIPDNPLLEKKISQNEAVAEFRLAKKSNTPAAYRDALEALDRAALQGNQVEKMKDAAQVSLALLLQKEPPHPLEELNQALFTARLLENKSLNDNLKKKYLNYLVNQLGLIEQMLQGDPEAKSFVSQSLNFLKEGDEAKSLDALTSAQKIVGNSRSLESVLNAFEKALLQRIMFPGLIEDLEALHPDPHLKESLKALQKGDHKLARLYLTEARQDIQREKWKVEKTNALQTLGHAIGEERHAISLNRQQAPADLIQKAQEFAKEKASPFLSLVYEEQTAQNACQQKPWDQALPYFDAGFQKASSTALSDQEKALFDWQAAYSLINEYQPQPQEQPTDFETTLSNLQQMRQQDRLPKAKVSAAMEEKPW